MNHHIISVVRGKIFLNPYDRKYYENTKLTHPVEREGEVFHSKFYDRSLVIKIGSSTNRPFSSMVLPTDFDSSIIGARWCYTIGNSIHETNESKVRLSKLLGIS